MKEFDFTKYLQQCVIYCDKNLLALNKPPFLPIHRGSTQHDKYPFVSHTRGAYEPSFFLLADYLDSLKLGNKHHPFIVHRLDKNTTGVLLLARRDSIARKLCKIFAERNQSSLHKEYLGIVELGEKSKLNVTNKYFRIASRITQKNTGFWSTLLVQTDGHSGLSTQGVHPDSCPTISIEELTDQLLNEGISITEYRLIERTSFCGKELGLVSLRPITGHTHQLRIHCAAHLHSPILGDYLYGGDVEFCRMIQNCKDLYPILTRNIDEKLSNFLYLHCHSVILPSITQKDTRSICINAKPPVYFAQIFPNLPRSPSSLA